MIHRAGVVARRGVEIPLARITAVRIEESLLGRLVGAGDLVIEAGHEDGEHRFVDIRRPGRTQRALHLQLDANARRVEP